MKHLQGSHFCRVAAALLALMLVLSAAPSLAQERDDVPMNWYEVFVPSYYDGDGDRVGDFKGLTEKLDYIADMGFDGIWLMPIHPSPSYHKYDVADYYAIAPEYGTMDDFRQFLAAAHARGIKVILDLVVNHTSNQHPWFLDAKSGEASPYREFYTFTKDSKSGYTQLPSGWYYESRFVSTMPDLNLDSDKVKQAIADVMRFWLEMGVDGFRLDAVTSYYTGDKTKNIAFLQWLNETAKAIAPDCFIVGECWESMYTIADYYQSGIDSFFLFPVSQGTGYIAKILSNEVEKKGQSYGNVVALLEKTYQDQLMTPFLGNHDTGRIANAVGYFNPSNVKMACGLLAMLKGSVFTYYGDEIGMVGVGNDPNKRIGMFWDKKMYIPRHPLGTTVAEYPLGSVEKQMDDPLSILQYYKAAMHLRKDNPEIAFGKSTLLESGDEDVCLMTRTYQGNTLLIAVNLSVDDKTLPCPQGFSVLSGELEVWGHASLQDGELTVPAYGIALVR